jgi:5-methyltetrahydropteroyltriglutamate--homocysteine methyltransferase
MVASANLGFPRIGPRRELKRGLEEHWAGKRSESRLLEDAATLRRDAWKLQQRLGIASIPSNDFSLYDHVLDTCAMLGAVPSRFGWDGGTVDLETYFAMARGRKPGGPRPGAPAMEMTKWFDTNYHYIVPEFEPGQTFRLASTKAVDDFLEAKALGVHTRPVLLGPVSFLLLGKAKSPDLWPLALLDAVLPVYAEVLRRLKAAGADWVQLDEPCLVLDPDLEASPAYASAYAHLREQAPGLRIMLATYFGRLGGNLALALGLPVDGLHLDLRRAPGQLEPVLEQAPKSLTLSLGLVDGRNVWRSDLARLEPQVERVVDLLGADRVQVAPSCSLIHSPFDLDLETSLDPEVRAWLAFAKQKLEEVVVLARAASGERAAVAGALEASAAAMQSRRASTRVHDPAVSSRMERVGEGMYRRAAGYAERRRAQQERLRLPLLPTTTIGSFPQTAAVRAARAERRAGKRTEAQYREYLEAEIASCVRFQEEAGIDVLVHGEFERNDMVEFFAEQLQGYVHTANGWVQSFGSRYVKPPILFGDVSRPTPMTVSWSAYAQSLTKRPVKGMLTGPITMLQWSFVRDDQPRAETALQLALAVRDEAADLERAGIQLIQIDEPALREGLPLQRSGWPFYLDWAVRAFRLASSGVRNETQIHTHMCYSEFGDIIEAVAALDADALSIETSRSQMELLGAFARYRYPNGIGPGVYDIHSPRVPARQEMVDLLRRALAVLAPDQLWVNPDCGLKTRRWEEVGPALVEMVAAAREVRLTLQ